MHSINFALKRAHLATNNYARKMIASNVPGMTPARFDIVCYLRQIGIRTNVPTHAYAAQERIIEVLGLHASTISKMLKRLEEMGWIRRSRDINNHRVKIVELTKLGLRMTWKAMRIVFRMRIWAKHYEWVVRRIRPDLHVIRALDFIVGAIEIIAGIIGDESTFQYEHGSRTRVPFRRSELPPPRERWCHDSYPKEEPRRVDEGEDEDVDSRTEDEKRLDELVDSYIRAMDPYGVR